MSRRDERNKMIKKISNQPSVLSLHAKNSCTYQKLVERKMADPHFASKIQHVHSNHLADPLNMMGCNSLRKYVPREVEFVITVSPIDFNETKRIFIAERTKTKTKKKKNCNNNVLHTSLDQSSKFEF